MTVDRSRMLGLVTEAARDAMSRRSGSAGVHEGTPLLGQGSTLDSLGLVTLLVDLEQTLRCDYGMAVTVVSDRAMSQKRSPFRTVGTLTDYLCLLAEEEQNAIGA
jgi:acyl carrier protein